MLLCSGLIECCLFRNALFLIVVSTVAFSFCRTACNVHLSRCIHQKMNVICRTAGKNDPDVFTDVNIVTGL